MAMGHVSSVPGGMLRPDSPGQDSRAADMSK